MAKSAIATTRTVPIASWIESPPDDFAPALAEIDFDEIDFACRARRGVRAVGFGLDAAACLIAAPGVVDDVGTVDVVVETGLVVRDRSLRVV